MKDMNDKQRDQLEDIFRSKLQNFESDPDPADLDAILQRLPARKVVPLRRKWQYVAAAAAVVFLIATGTFYFYTEETLQSPLVQQARQETEVLDNQLKQEQLKTITEPVQLADGDVLHTGRCGLGTLLQHQLLMLGIQRDNGLSGLQQIED